MGDMKITETPESIPEMFENLKAENAGLTAELETTRKAMMDYKRKYRCVGEYNLRLKSKLAASNAECERLNAELKDIVGAVVDAGDINCPPGLDGYGDAVRELVESRDAVNAENERIGSDYDELWELSTELTLKLEYLNAKITNGVNSFCTCGGMGPIDKGACPACMVWHELREGVEL